ncbi:MAG: hypothetical protein NC111_00985 [Bacteroides sp.]|nr:hypothetical protein [Bacteroides sp.]MCM1413539.1 hypothetical protein [Bacteroides sp.]MCM1471093.1 hypothetical protein [Bacteroides sp.]
MKITLSVSDICDRILAQTALQYFISDCRRPPLTDDERLAIRRMIIPAASPVVLAMLAVLTDMEHIDDDQTPDGLGGLLSYEINPELSVDIIRLRLLAEEAIASTVLAEVFAADNDKASTKHERAALRAIHSIRDLVAGATLL